MTKYKLKKPITFEGKEIKEFNFDFDKITRKDYNRCKREAKVRDKKDTSAIIVFSETFRLVFAGVAAGVLTEIMFNLYPKDVVAINKIVFKYFFGDDFEDDEELDLDFKDEKSEDTNNFLYKLRKPFVSGNKTITELKLDFDSLTYLDYKKCESQVRRMAENSFNIIPSENENFQLCFAAMASGFEVEEFIKKLSIADYLVVCMKVIDFLTDTESEEEEMQTENTQESQTISNE